MTAHTYGWESIGRSGHVEPASVGKLVRALKDALEELDVACDLHECAGSVGSMELMREAVRKVSDLSEALVRERRYYQAHPEDQDAEDQADTAQSVRESAYAF